MRNFNLFKNIWRLNAILITLICILIFPFLVLGIYRDRVNRIADRGVVVVNQNINLEETFYLGKLDRIKGSEFVIVPLYARQKTDLGLYPDEKSISTRNILFADVNKGINKWLLPNNNTLISHYDLISSLDDKDQRVIAFLYQIISADTNQDGRLTENDALSVALSLPDSSNYRKILDNIKSVVGYELLSSDRLAILYMKNDQGFICYVKLPEFQIIKEIPIPPFNS